MWQSFVLKVNLEDKLRATREVSLGCNRVFGLPRGWPDAGTGRTAMLRRFVLTACLSGALLPAFAADPALEVQEPWARATAGRAPNGAAYLTIVNPGVATDRLLGATAPVAKAVELHAHLMDGGVMRMREVSAIEIHPGEPAMLRPGGLHVMLIGLKEPLKEGTTFPLTLRFERAGEMVVPVRVLGVAARGANS